MLHRPHHRKYIAIFLLVATLASFIVAPSPAHAQFGIPQTVIKIGDIIGTIWRAIDKANDFASKVGFRNILNVFLNNLAYNTATKLATGAPGKKPLFYTNLETFIKDAADVAVGQLSQQILNATGKDGTCQRAGNKCISDNQCPIMARMTEQNPLYNDYKNLYQGYTTVSSEAEFDDALRNGWVVPGTLGRDKCQVPLVASLGPIDICRISTPLAEIRLKTIALNLQRPQSPRCTFSQLKNNFKDLRNANVADLVQLSEMFNPTSNEIGVILNLNARGRQQISESVASERLLVILGRGMKQIADAISGKTKTPPGLSDEATKEALFRQPLKSQSDPTGKPLTDAIGVFTNTLVSKLFTRIFETGFNPETDERLVQNFFGGISGVAAAKIKFAELLRADDITTVQRNSGALLTELTSRCDIAKDSQQSNIPDDALRDARNCVIDEGFRQAIAQHMTVQQALDDNLLDRSRPFGITGDGAGAASLANETPHVYSIRSITILRQLSIVPVGWELAAKYIKEVLHPQLDDKTAQREYTLPDLIAQYSNSSSPFYRMIDPDWLLKAPVAWTERRSAGEDITFDERIIDGSRLIRRATQAIDEQTCIYENEDGTGCLGNNFGYCTEQKPIWRVDGKACNPVFATCQTFIRTSDSSRVSYLARTIDHQLCEQNSAYAGCRKYARERDPSTGDWLPSPLIYLDSDAKSCQASAAGCSEFIRLLHINLDPFTAPELDSEITRVRNIVDGDGNIIGEISDYDGIIDRKAFNSINNQADCSSEQDFDGNGFFDDNVACRLYTPISFEGPEIPGVVVSATVDAEGNITAYNDECPLECVGYKPYEETAYAPFYPDNNFVNLITAAADQCSAAAEGCTEFTVENPAAFGGEDVVAYTRLRECVFEDNPSADVYVTLSSIKDTAFQARTWKLVSNGPGGGPRHSGDLDYDLCDASIYQLTITNPEDPQANPDCLKFRDSELNSYYRLLSRVIFATNECRQLRRSDNENLYFGLPEFSTSCKLNDVGCRRYRESGAGNSEVILFDTFEGGTSAGWSGGNVASDSTHANGHSLFVETGAVGGFVKKSVIIKETQRYVLKFWARSVAAAVLIADITGPEGPLPVDGLNSVTLSDQWSNYTIGPFTMDQTPNGFEALHFTSLSDIYLDNIRLIGSKDEYLIKDSWTTPALCLDPTPNGQLFCEEYRNDLGNTQYIKNFSRLCQDRFIGCEAMIKTYETDNVATTTISAVIEPADEIAYIINSQKFACAEEGIGCRELGLESVDREGVVGYSSRYKILDPDHDDYNYEVAVCEAEYELCEEYVQVGSGQGFPRYFKNPQDRLCEFKDRPQFVAGFNEGKTGWFKVQSTPYVIDDVCQFSTDAQPRGTITVCDGKDPLADNPTGCYSYSCQASQSSCAEFQDPVTPKGCDSNQLDPEAENACDFYYLLKDSVIDERSGDCTSINPQIGCIGFFDTKEGLDSRSLRANCQSGCDLSFGCVDPVSDIFDRDIVGQPVFCSSGADCTLPYVCRPIPVSASTANPACAFDLDRNNPDSKLGCGL